MHIIYQGEMQSIGGEWYRVSTSIKAEYMALIYGLVLVDNFYKSKQLVIYCDCQPVVKQLLGEYGVNKDHLKPYFNAATHLLKRFDYKLIHIGRKSNKIADKLSKLCNLQKNNK